MEVLLVGLGALGVTAAAVPRVHRCSPIGGASWIDPGPLKTHESPCPISAGWPSSPDWWWAGGPVGRSSWFRSARPWRSGSATTASGFRRRCGLWPSCAWVPSSRSRSPIHLPGWAGVPLVMAASVLLINGFNLLDGLDMLSAGVAGVAAVGFAVVVHGPGRLLAASLAGALVAFLCYNRPPARIYLGDGGSYVLGATMTVLLTYASGIGVSNATGVLALALLAVPVAEVACAIVRRTAQRPFASGRRPRPSLRPPRGSRIASHSGQRRLHRCRGGGGHRGCGGRPCVHERGPGNRPGSGISRSRGRGPRWRIGSDSAETHQ